jgi:hypothetical protein
VKILLQILTGKWKKKKKFFFPSKKITKNEKNEKLEKNKKVALSR